MVLTSSLKQHKGLLLIHTPLESVQADTMVFLYLIYNPHAKWQSACMYVKWKKLLYYCYMSPFCPFVFILLGQIIHPWFFLNLSVYVCLCGGDVAGLLSLSLNRRGDGCVEWQDSSLCGVEQRGEYDTGHPQELGKISGRKHSCECSGQANIRIVMPLSVSILYNVCVYVCIVGYISNNMHFTAFICTYVYVWILTMFKCCNRHQWRRKQIRYIPILYS